MGTVSPFESNFISVYFLLLSTRIFLMSGICGRDENLDKYRNEGRSGEKSTVCLSRSISLVAMVMAATNVGCSCFFQALLLLLALNTFRSIIITPCYSTIKWLYCYHEQKIGLCHQMLRQWGQTHQSSSLAIFSSDIYKQFNKWTKLKLASRWCSG